MKVMIIEDNKTKNDSFTNHLISQGIKRESILFAKNMTDLASQLNHEIALYIIDFNIPNYDTGKSEPNGRAILECITKSKNSDALLIAISSYPNDFPNFRELYESHGCILADFNKTNNWKSTLNHLIIQIKNKLRFDFIIFCALDEERSPYITLLDGEHHNRGGIDCYDIKVNENHGSVILLPEMGLVNAAIYAGLCIEKFKPKLICMSGICGGFSQKVKLGQLLISSLSYEYQSGKWSNDTFINAPYQANTDYLTLTKLKSLISKTDALNEFEDGLPDGLKPKEKSKPEAVIFTSGSAVIASEERLNSITAVHAKVRAIDMEVFAIQRAAELSQYRPNCVCAKVVVDLCDSNKNDDLHVYGSYTSAKFMIKAIDEIL